MNKDLTIMYNDITLGYQKNTNTVRCNKSTAIKTILLKTLSSASVDTITDLCVTHWG